MNLILLEAALNMDAGSHKWHHNLERLFLDPMEIQLSIDQSFLIQESLLLANSKTLGNRFNP